MVQPVVGLYFSDEPPTRTPAILRLGSQGIDIAPGDAAYTINDSYVLPVDVELYAVQPHAHYRARDVRGDRDASGRHDAIADSHRRMGLPLAARLSLRAAAVLPNGTRLSMEYRYDNSIGTRAIRIGRRGACFGDSASVDEMGDLWFQFVPSSARDLEPLRTEAQRKMTIEDTIGYETMLRVTPEDFELHDDVALLYLGIGPASEAAIRHFRRSAELRPALVSAHFNLATALSVAVTSTTRSPNTSARFEIDPRHASAHNNLGTVLSAIGRPFTALHHFQQAVLLDPSNAQAQSNFARELAHVMLLVIP